MERMKCSVRLVCAFGRIGARFRLIEEWNEEGEGGEVGQWMALKFYMHLFQTARPYRHPSIHESCHCHRQPLTSHESRLVQRAS